MFPQIFGKYVLEREIAAGGMARVFLGTLRGAEGFEKRLVVKQIRPELAADEAFVTRFVGEAKTAVELSHPNIVPVYELGVEQGVYYVAMEYCAGVTLADVLIETGPLYPEEGAYLGAEVCRALDYAHRRAGIVHRDVTPRNVLIDDEGAVRVIDFGIALPVEASGPSREIFGSPGHMPPEQLRGEPLGPPADVFAVGALLVEAFTGRPPFRRATPQECAAALKQPLPPLHEDAPALEPLDEPLRRALALDAKQRPQDAEELGRVLRDFVRGTDSVSVARRLAERVTRVRRAERRPSDGTRVRSSVPPLYVTPSGLTPVTQTFAARDELTVWTRRLSSAPPAGVPSSAPPAAEHAKPAAPRGTDTRRLPEKPSSSPASLGPPVSASRASTGRARQAGLPYVAVAAAVLSAGAVGFALSSRASEDAAPREPSPPPSRPQVPVELAVLAPTGGTAPSAVPPAGDTAVPERPQDGPQGEPTRRLEREPSNRASISASARAEEREPVVAAPAPSATLRLTADPPAVVTVDGEGISQTSSTPVRQLTLRPGAYRVTFRNETYGPPVATRVALDPGSERSVHADFRSAEPRITQR